MKYIFPFDEIPEESPMLFSHKYTLFKSAFKIGSHIIVRCGSLNYIIIQSLPTSFPDIDL